MLYYYDNIVSTWEKKVTPYTTEYRHPTNTTHYVHIGKNAKVDASTRILPGSFIYDAVIGKSCLIGAYSIIDDAVVIENNVTIEAYVHLREGVRVKSYACIEESVMIYPNTVVNERVIIHKGIQIDRGLFIEKDPIFIKGSKHPLFWFDDTRVQIGCNTFHIDVWLSKYREHGELNEYSEKEIEEYHDYLKLLKAHGSPYVKLKHS